MFKLIDMPAVDTSIYKKDKEGRVNPFHVDLWSMGERISKDIYRMFPNHKTADFEECYFINVRTGERQKMKAKE